MRSLSLFILIFGLIFVLSIRALDAQFWGRCRSPLEVYQECSSTCPDTCNDIQRPNPYKPCSMICKNGCDCMRPYVRLNANPMSPCVHPRQCMMIRRRY